MSNATLTEVPLVTQEHTDRRQGSIVQRYSIQNDLRISKCNNDDDHIEPFWDGDEEEWKSRVHGSAAKHFTKKTQTLVRTAACVEEPYVLSVVKLDMNGIGNKDKNGSGCPLSAVELDLSHVDATILGNVIKTMIFRREIWHMDDEMEMTESVNVVEILLVDSQANMLSITLDYETLLPLSPSSVEKAPSNPNSNPTATHISTQSILSMQNIHPHAHTRYMLTSTQVVSLDPDRIVLAISPFLLCLNLTNQKVALWTKESCHYNRRKSLSRVLRSAKGMLIGPSKVGEEEEFVEDLENASVMASTAALCVFNKVQEDSGYGYDNYDDVNDDADADKWVNVNGKVVCSLHSDGTVRMWTCALLSQTFTYARSMRILYGVEDVRDGSIMPSPNLWSSSSDSLLIDGHSFVTGNGSQFVVMVGIRIAENVGVERTSSPFYLTALGGGLNTSDPVDKARMTVPLQVDSLTAMDFVRLEKGTTTGAWELRALYSSTPNRAFKESGYMDASIYASFSRAPSRETMVAIYQSNGPEPLFVQTSNTFEKLVEDEREKIINECNLMSRNGLSLDIENEDIDFVLREIDGWYLQRLFRSGSVQTIGLDRATDGTIRRALLQVVPPLCVESSSQREANGNSMELETLHFMNKWSKFDETRSSAKVSTRSAAKAVSQNSSIYSEFYNADTLHSSTPEIAEDSDDEMESGETSTRERRIQESHSRWKKLFLAISYEETKLLSPMGFSDLPSSGKGLESSLILRPGITSAIVLSKPVTSGAVHYGQLDSIVMAIFERIENAEGSSIREILSWLDSKVWRIVSRAKLLYKDDASTLIADVSDVISSIGLDWGRLSSKLLIKLNTMSQEAVHTWLLSPLPSFLRSEVKFDEDSSVAIDNASDASLIIPNASRLSKIYIAECQRLALARYICVVGIGASGNALFNVDQERASLVAYLHTVTTSWACAQLCTSVSEYKNGTEVSTSIALNSSKESPPKKVSVLSVNLSKVLKLHDSSPVSASIVPSIFRTSMVFVRSAMEASDEIYPELAIVPGDDARISLRLLSPLVAFPSRDPASKSRNVKAADCLLSEIFVFGKSDSLGVQRVEEFLEHASTLLKGTFSVRSDPDSLGAVFEALCDHPEQLSSEENAANEFYDKDIMDAVKGIFAQSAIPVRSDDIIRLSNMEKMKKLLLPWIILSREKKINTLQIVTERLGQFVEDPANILGHAASVMLTVSKLVERVQVLEKHHAMVKFPKLRNPFAKVLIAAINDLIGTVQSHAKASEYMYLVEYPALWSALFRNALEGHCWDDAFESCLANPLIERRISNFKRLILAMADAGAWGIVLDKIIFFIVNGNDSNSDIDLYELATETLVEASHRACGQKKSDSPSARVDYRGCLFALHAAYGNWRRSCQAIDYYGALTLRSIPEMDDDYEIGSMPSSPLTDEENDRIMDEIVLSAVSSAQLIQLIENPGLRYIVSGELADPLIVGGGSLEDGDAGIENVMRRDDGGISRSSRLYSDKDLLLRAKRLVSLLSLQRDALSPADLLDILNASDTSIIDALPRLGYFDHAIALSHCKLENKDGAKPLGRDVFVDAISHMLCKCLAPAALSLSRSSDCDIDMEDNIKSRPTMHQLRLLTGDGRLSCSHDSWQEVGIVVNAERGAYAMELLRLYTETYAAEDNSIALDLAKTLLDLDDSRAALPVWLTTLILGRSASDGDGLFAMNGGNPTALLNLYVRNGLYLEACDLVVIILMGCESERQRAATSRLPEEGNIDFVPYEAIDKLWNLIETYCQTSMNHAQKEEILNARSAMEGALEKHFKLMQISEQGMLSARALKGR